MKPIRCLLLTVLSLFLLWKNSEVFNTNAIPVDDFVAYWAASRLQLQGLNPYSASEILAVERAVGMQGDEPLIMLNPPWTLVFLLPFGFLDYPAGRLAWLLLALSSVFLSAHWLWLVYQGPHHSLRLALALAFCFVPLLVCLILGQITPLILLGVSGFLYFEGRSKPLSAGACLVLLALKPQLFYLFWLGLFLWVLHGRRWKILWGASICGATAITLGAIWDSAIIAHYVEFASSQPPMLHWRTPTLGTLLRTIIGMEQTWLQFAPMFAGTAWLLFHWKNQRDGWVWSEQMPLILVVSLTTTSYVWFYDQMLFLPVILQVAATGLVSRSKSQQRSMVTAFVVMNLILAILIFFKLSPLYFVWSFGCWLVLYWLFFLRNGGTLAPHAVGQMPVND